jgi:putative ABC transport system permease protein
LGRGAAERDLQEEVAAHIDAEVRGRIERGESPQAAREAAVREFGNIGLVTEVTRDMWGFGGLEQFLQDVRYGVRILRKSPGLTAAVTLMLALGIGGVTAMFAFVNGILLRPLPFPSPDRLVTIWEVPPKTTKANVVALQNFEAWKEQSRSFQSMAAIFSLPINLITPEASEQVPGMRVTAEFFQTLGTPPLLGRTFRPGEFYRDSPKEVILSYDTWKSRFGGSRDVIGKKISVDVSHHEIIGVMPPGFGLPGIQADLYVPLALHLGEGRNYSVVARLRPHVSASAANAEIAAIAARTSKTDPELNAGWSATVIPLLDQTVGGVRSVLLVVFTAVCLLMLLACANIANLLLMHSSARNQEISVRLALGAGKLRIARQLLVEVLLLAILGGLAGTVLAVASVDLARITLPEALHLPRVNEISIDGRVLALCTALTMLSCVLFGLAPGAQSLKRDIVRELHSVTRSVTSGSRLRNALVVAEVAIAVIVVAGAGLLMRSFVRLTRVDPGFHAEHVLTMQMLLLPVTDQQYHAQVVDDMLKRIRALPGVMSAGSIGILPMQGINAGTWYYRADGPDPAPANRPQGDVSIITPGYFRTLGVPILEGRDFNDYDRKGSQPVAILNQAAARMLFPGESPIGKRLKVDWADPAPIVQVVGVARDIRHSTLSAPPDPCLFMPNDQQPFPFTGLVVRTIGNPLALTSAIRKQIREVDSDQGISKVETMTQMVAGSIARPRAEAFLLSAFGVIALLIACVGLYGVIAYSVAQRSRSIGIRLALGASSTLIFRDVLADGLRLTLVGLCIGIAAATLVTRYVRSLLYEIQPSDPVTLWGVVAAMIVVSLLACYWPARRAMLVDPADMLRQE